MIIKGDQSFHGCKIQKNIIFPKNMNMTLSSVSNSISTEYMNIPSVANFIAAYVAAVKKYVKVKTVTQGKFTVIGGTPIGVY